MSALGRTVPWPRELLEALVVRGSIEEGVPTSPPPGAQSDTEIVVGDRRCLPILTMGVAWTVN